MKLVLGCGARGAEPNERSVAMGLTVITQTLADLEAPVDKSNDVFAACKQDVIKSPVAQKVFSTLEKWSSNVGVLFVDKGVDSMYIPPFQYNGGGTYSGGIAVVNATNPLEIGDTKLPLGVSLIHELGHAVQYKEDASGFEEKFKTANSDRSDNQKFSIMNADGKALTKYVKATKVAQLMIENDNVARHEAPVCDDLGLPFRKKYS
jgi:hypothetical protein